jgi:transketolase
MRDAFIGRLEALAEANSRILLITGDLGFGVLTSFEKRFPRQFVNAGVAEQNMTGLATGLALDGRIVFTYSIGNFPTLRCLEQIRNDAAYHGANVKIVAIGGGFSYGALGMSHHATEDLAILRALGITVVAPGCDWEAAEAATALADRPGTCYIRLDRTSAGSTALVGEHFQIGRARMLRPGTDVTLISTGGILSQVLLAAETLSQAGVQARVLSMHTIQPLDDAAVRSAVMETGGIVTVEEHTVHGGLGGAVAEYCLEAGVIPKAFRRVGLRDGFSAIVGSQDYLRQQSGLDERAIVDAAKHVVAASARTSVGVAG